MKNIMHLTLLLLVTTVLMSACKKRVNCDNSDEKQLGAKEFTALDETWNIEDTVQTMIFVDGDENEIELIRQASDSSELRVNDYLVCEEIDIKPYRAYAYYVYPRLDNVFGNDSTVLLLEPRIMKEGERFYDYLFINYAYGISSVAKAAIPVSENGNSPGTDKRFAFHSSLELDGNSFSDVWYYNEDNTSIIYSRQEGIVAVEKNDVIYNRKK